MIIELIDDRSADNCSEMTAVIRSIITLLTIDRYGQQACNIKAFLGNYSFDIMSAENLKGNKIDTHRILMRYNNRITSSDKDFTLWLMPPNIEYIDGPGVLRYDITRELMMFIFGHRVVAELDQSASIQQLVWLTGRHW